MLDALSDAAWRRPWALLGTALALVALLVLVAAAGIGSVGVSAPSATAPGGGPVTSADLVVVTRDPSGADSRVYGVALDVISAGIASDEGVEEVRRGPVSRDKQTASLIVVLDDDDPGAARKTAERLAGDLDPGPLKVSFAGRAAVGLDARDVLAEDLWRLELLILPLAALALVATLGLWSALAPLLAIVGGIAGALAALVVAEAVAGASLIGAAPGALVGLVLGIELPAALIARFRDEAELGGPEAALAGAVQDTGPGVAAAATAAALVPAALVITGLEGSGSILIACASGALLCLVTVLLATPALIRLGVGRASKDPDSPLAENRYTRALRTTPRMLARSRWRAAAALVVCAGALVAAAWPALEGVSEPFGAGDLPRGAGARATLLLGGAAAAAPAGDSLFPELPLAGAVALALAGVSLWLAARGVRGALLAPLALLASAAAAGLGWLVFGEGTLAGLLGQERQGALETGALAAALAALASVCTARSVSALETTRVERELDPGPPGVAERAAGLTLPGVVAATVVAAGAAAVLGGSELVSAREFGLLCAVGLLLDLLLVRSPFLALAARLLDVRGGRPASPGGAQEGARRRRLRWPRWPTRNPEGSAATPTPDAAADLEPRESTARPS